MEIFKRGQFDLLVAQSFWGTLGTIGAVAATVATGGAAAPLIPIAASVGGAIDARNAEKKAAEQEAGGNEKAAALYDPYTARGNDAGNTLAGLMGLPMHGGAPGGVSAPQIAGARPGVTASRIPQQPVAAPAPPQTLAAMMARGKTPVGPITSYGNVMDGVPWSMGGNGPRHPGDI